MKKGHSHLIVVLDRSGSMDSCVNDTIGGFNTFLEAQKKEKGSATLTLIQFDNLYEPNYVHVPLERVKPLSTRTYQPRGSTALLDALGRTIDDEGQWLASLPEKERPSHVVCVVITDGQENASHRYSGEMIRTMVKHQTEKYQWEFMYLGANVDAFAEAGSMGFSHHNTMAYRTDSAQAVDALYSTISNSISNARVGRSAAIRPEDREAMEKLMEQENK